MPVIANNVSLAAGASSVNVFDNTNYQFVNEGTEIRVSAAVVGANDGVQGSTSTIDSRSTTQSLLTTRLYPLLSQGDRLLTVLHRIEQTQLSPQDRRGTDHCLCLETKLAVRL